MKNRHQSARRTAHVAGLMIAAGTLLGACAMTEDPLQASGRMGIIPDANNYASVMRVADAMRAGGDFTSAVTLYRRANALAPIEVEPLIKLGATLADLRALNEAMSAYRAALTLDPKNTEAMRGLGNALLALDQPQLAKQQFETALAADDKDPRTHNSLGVVLDLLGDHRGAQGRYRAGLAVTPDNLLLRNNLGLSLALSGDYAEAIGILRPLAAHPAATPRNRQNLALVYGLSGDPDSAARIARIDLDEAAVQSNIAYYATLRQMADRPRTTALGANPVRFEVMGVGTDRRN